MLILESDKRSPKLGEGLHLPSSGLVYRDFPDSTPKYPSTGAVLRRFHSPLQASAPAGSVILEPDLEICDAAQTGTPVCLLAASPELL